MRILVVANLPPYVFGGAENQVAQLVETWSDLGHHVEVAGHRIPDGVLRLGIADIRTHHIAFTSRAGRGGRAASYFFSMARLLHRIRRNFDVIYCRGLGDGAISICLLKATGEMRLPLVACPINAKGAGDSHFIRSIPGWRLLVRAVNRHCDAITIIATAIRSDLVELGIGGPRIAPIPNGIKLGDPIRRSGVASARRLVFAGRLTAQKGIDNLLKALARVAAGDKSFSLEIIGDGPNLPQLIERCRKLGLEQKVRFAGALPHETIRSRLADTDVFVLPSRYEGMSNAALEAMEAGLPVLLTRCGGIDSYIDESTGWICEPDDVDSLTAALLRMLDTPDNKLLEMGKQSRLLVERDFCIETIGRKNAELFEQLIGSSQHGFDRSG